LDGHKGRGGGQTAVVWIIRNQFGRRNLSNYTRVELVLKLEPLLRVKAKENQRLSDGKGKQKSADLKAEPIETRQELAKAAGVSHDTIAKGKVIQAKASEETKAALASVPRRWHQRRRRISFQDSRRESPVLTILSKRRLFTL